MGEEQPGKAVGKNENEDAAGPLAVSYTDLVAVLVLAVQEQSRTLDEVVSSHARSRPIKKRMDFSFSK